VLHALTILLAVVLVGLLLESIDDFDVPEPDNPPGPGDPAPPHQLRGLARVSRLH